jgi:Protein of unknown function (DUF4058)
MSIHDWTRVSDGVFHDFHLAWIAELRHVLNEGLLPPDYYALGEQVAGALGPDVLTLREPAPLTNGDQGIPGTTAVTTAAPRVTLTLEARQESYTQRQRTLVIRHASDHRIVALIEIVSAANKSSQYALDTFIDKSLGALRQGIHLLLLDLRPPTPRDPSGIHGVLWAALTGEEQQLLADKPLTLVAYTAGPIKRAYVEPCAIGDAMIDMPLFLDPELYVNVPLEQTYMEAYRGVPRYYRTILEAS